MSEQESVETYQDVDLDTHLSQEFIEDELEGDGEFDPVLSQLTREERAVLDKVQKLQMEQDPVINMFKQLENKPSEAEIEGMKQTVGDVFLAGFSEHENFIFRPLKRLEWRTLIKQIEKIDEMKKEEAIVMKGVVWPKLTQLNINVLSAGTIATMKDLILRASNFMGPDTALELVRKL